MKTQDEEYDRINVIWKGKEDSGRKKVETCVWWGQKEEQSRGGGSNRECLKMHNGIH